MSDQKDIRKDVSTRYGQIASSGGACCSTGEVGPEALGMSQHAQAIGYQKEDLETLPAGANLGLGCGSPTTITLITEGMTVLDLGSGAGIDCFIASKKVGPSGKVIGVDMTDEMLDKATQFAKEHNYDNVEFRKGFIESLPLEDNSVDLVISNCVINLSPDKSKVFAEINRVLKPGGQAALSDIVLLKPLPDGVLSDLEAYIGCIAGAESIGDYLGKTMLAGLQIGKANQHSYDVMQVLGCSPEAGKLLTNIPKDFDGNQYVASLDMLAVKPAQAQQPAQPSSSCCSPGGSCC